MTVRYRRSLWALSAAVLALALPAHAQPPGGRGGVLAVRTAKQAAPVDFTGYWVSVVTEDWRWRMVTPIKGDFASIPLNAEGRKIGMAWDPAKDEAAGEQCKAYGAAALMRVPGRLHITWEDERPVRGSGAPQAGLGATREGNQGRSLEVVTTQMRPGYLRKNGPPYSGSTVLKEYFDLSKERNGDTWFVVTTVVEDPQYLTEPFVTSTNFKKEPDGSKWSPTACSAR
jgi:hypothetical protein